MRGVTAGVGLCGESGGARPCVAVRAVYGGAVGALR